MKYLLSFLAFSLALTLGANTLAEEHTKPDVIPQPIADTSKAIAPGTPELIEPTFMSTVTGTSTSLKWKAVEGADYYLIQVATDPNFKWQVASEPMLKTNQFEVKNLEVGKHYYWRVFAGNSTNIPGSSKSMPAKSMFITK